MHNEYEEMMLDKLKSHLHDTIDSDLTPSDIHQAIIDTIQEDIDYFQDCIDKLKRLMSLVNNNQKTYILTVQEDPVSGDLYLDLPPDCPWKEGDIIEWTIQDSKTVILKTKLI